MISAIPTRRARRRGDAKSRRGAVLMVAMIFVLVFAIAAASILTLSMTSYRMTMRNDMQAQARAVAETELEYVYYQFYLRCKYGKPAIEVPGELSTIAQTHNSPSDHTPIDPSAADNPFPAFLLAHRNAGWRVGRSMVVTAGPVYGYIPANLMSAYGATSYVDAKIEVRPPANSPYASTVVVRVGRQFFDYAYAIFQHAVFYQGDLELYPGASLTINGDVVANGSIYMGSTGATINLTGKVSYLHNNYYNTAADGLEHLAKPNTPAESIGLNTSPTFTDSRAHQLTEMQQAEDLLGGADPDLLHTTYPDLFPTVNDVYRAALVPPPEAVGGICDEYPTWTATMADAPEISSQRIYNRAGLRVMVNSDGTFTVNRPVDPINLASGYVATTDYNSAIVGTGTVWDAREGREVTITTIDVAQLKTALDANDPATGVPRGRSFNGILYVYLKHGTADQPSAIRLKNGATLPLSGAQQRTGLGVATNGGIYVQGDYNTTRLPNGTVMPDSTILSGGVTNPQNPAMLMGDAVTLLSTGWSDTNDQQHLDTALRDANTTGNLVDNEQHVNAGLLVGNVPASASTNSGGVQNLVRYLENWTGKTVSFTGSLGRLFDSKMFTRGFVGTWNGGTYDPTKDVYKLPNNRNFIFDTNMTKLPPPGSPLHTKTSRGRYYFW